MVATMGEDAMGATGPGAEPRPLADMREEARRVLATAEQRGVAVRLFGGVGVAMRSPSAARPELQRRYNDLDFGGLSRQGDQIAALFTALGYEADRSFNALRGHQRMLFWDRLNDRQVDVVLDRLRMCHTLDFKDRLTVDALTVPLAELLLFKLQIVEANQKDIVDSITLLGDHPVGDRDGDCINAAHIARLAADDWGLHHTLDLSLERVGRHATSLAVDLPFAIEDQIACLRSRMEEERKSARWKMRARLGERMKWYELPEEVRG